MSVNKKFDKIKAIKRMSRLEGNTYGRDGFHETKDDKPRQHNSLTDYLNEVDEERNMHITIGMADIVTAFDELTIGTKVLHRNAFLTTVKDAVAIHDFNAERVPGQAVIELPEKACHYVSAGVGQRTKDPSDYVARLYRNRVQLYLKRGKAAQCDNVRVVVYTLDAYLNDPDVDLTEADRISENNCTHVLIAVLGSAGPKSPLSPGIFVHNLAGGNHEAMSWSAEEIRQKAGEIESYNSGWCTVAD